MIRFNKNSSTRTLPPVSTASLPDIVFILLFFFMTVTVMKNQNLLVENTLPTASETEKLDKKDRVIEIYIGKAKDNGKILGDEPRIQMDNKLITVDEVSDYALQALSLMPEHLRSVATVSIKADVDVKMGIIEDLKKRLREVNLLKINYTTYEGDMLGNL